VPIEAELLSVIEDYLDSRAGRLPATLKSSTAKGLSRWPANAPLFVGRDGQRITRGTIQSRVRRAARERRRCVDPASAALCQQRRAAELVADDRQLGVALGDQLGRHLAGRAGEHVHGVSVLRRGPRSRDRLVGAPLSCRCLLASCRPGGVTTDSRSAPS
jgi:hypothetical protein